MDYLSQNIEKIGMATALEAQLTSHQIESPVTVRMKKGSGLEMVYRGHSLYDPEKPIEHAVADIQKLQGESDQDLVIYFGLGFGIHAEFLKKRFNAPLLIFEPSIDILKTTLSMRPFALEDVTVESSFGRLAEIVDRRLELSDRRLIVAVHPQYRHLFAKEIERFTFVVQQAANNVMIRHATLGRGSIWAQYEIENMRDTVQLPPITALKEYAQNVPGIFIGAGPSLSKNIEVLKKFKNHAVIIAAATALRPLDNAGIKPDVVMVIESNPSDYQFEGVSFLNELTVAPTPFSHPENFKLPVKQKMSLLNHPSPTHDWMTRAYDNVDSVLTAGSVALAAFSTLHCIGCNPIIAVGMDLAFTLNQTHAKGADSASVTTRFNKEKQLIEYVVLDPESYFVKTFVNWEKQFNKGDVYKTREAHQSRGWGDREDVYSDTVFTSYRAWLEGAADTWASDRTLINATEGGARIEGFTEMSLAEAAALHTDKNCPAEQWIDDICRTYVPRALAPLQKEIETELALVQQVEQLAEKSRITARQAIGLIQKNKLNAAQKELNRLDPIEKEMGALTRKTRILNQISQQAATTIRLKRLEDRHDDVLIQTQNSLKRSISLYEEIELGCTEAIQLFEKARNIITQE